jgi:hypothetical protein
MFNRNALLLVAGAAFFTLDASIATAQARKPTSSKRIPITKESPGEVTPPRVDTVTVYRTDTLRTPPQVDTVRLTNTVTRVDTVVQQVTMIPRKIGGLYLGLGAGPALPFGAIRTVNQPGAMGQINLGWQGINNPLGIRADVGFTQYAHSAQYASLGDRPKVWNGNLDLRLNLPFFNHTLGSGVLFSPYLIGGGSYLRYSDLRMQLDTDGGAVGGVGPQHAVIAGSEDNAFTSNSDYHDSWGWNAGGGLAFHAGKKEMFVEARAVSFRRSTNLFERSWHVPITFGVNFF